MFTRYARITGNCAFATEDGSAVETLKNKVGIQIGKLGDATILEVDGNQVPVPNSMLEYIKTPELEGVI